MIYLGKDFFLKKGILSFDVRIGAEKGLWRTFNLSILNYTPELYKMRCDDGEIEKLNLLEIFVLEIPFIGIEFEYKWAMNKKKEEKNESRENRRMES